MATKARKQEIVLELKNFFENGKVALVADLSGLTVFEITQFRRKLDKAQAKCRIAKNTLLKIATKDTEFVALKDMMVGPTAIVVGYDDLVAPAKTTLEFIKKINKGEVRGGVVEGRLISQSDVKRLSSLPSREELLASIMGQLDSGASGIASSLEAIIRDIACLIEEVAKKNAA